MRKAATVIGLGAFFLTMALLLKFYAYGRLAVVPLTQNTQQVVADPAATFFDADTVAPGRGALLTKVTVVADPAASRRAAERTGRDVVVFDQWRYTDNNNEAPPMDASSAHVAIERHTGEAINCCDTTANGKPMKFAGQVIKFPFQTGRQTYSYWDGTISKATPMSYSGEETIKGLKTYRFTGKVPLTQFRTQDVPRKIFGLPDASVSAQRWYENERTVWVEPETGVFIKAAEKQHQILRIDEPGAKDVNALTTTSVMDDATVSKNVDEYKPKAGQLKIVRLWGPLALGLIGLGLILAGLAMSRRVRSARAEGVEDDADLTWEQMRDDQPQYVERTPASNGPGWSQREQYREQYEDHQGRFLADGPGAPGPGLEGSSRLDGRPLPGGRVERRDSPS